MTFATLWRRGPSHCRRHQALRYDTYTREPQGRLWRVSFVTSSGLGCSAAGFTCDSVCRNLIKSLPAICWEVGNTGNTHTHTHTHTHNINVLTCLYLIRSHACTQEHYNCLYRGAKTLHGSLPNSRPLPASFVPASSHSNFHSVGCPQHICLQELLSSPAPATCSSARVTHYLSLGVFDCRKTGSVKGYKHTSRSIFFPLGSCRQWAVNINPLILYIHYFLLRFPHNLIPCPIPSVKT